MADVSSNLTKPILADHLIAYVDLLGFRSLVANPAPDLQIAILETLQEFKQTERNFEYNVERGKDGHTTHTLAPAISSFSDHMVLAFKLDQFDAIGVYQALLYFRYVINGIAHRARQFNSLIRGAVTTGPLYHENGIVFGQGLVAAYELESNVAVYPRIIVDHHALDGISPSNRAANQAMFEDDDGYWCIDYTTAYLESLDERYGSAPSKDGCTARRAWALTTRANALDMAQKCESSGDGRATQNWAWFSSRFEKSMLSVNQHRFSMDGSPISFPDRMPLRLSKIFSNGKIIST